MPGVAGFFQTVAPLAAVQEIGFSRRLGRSFSDGHSIYTVSIRQIACHRPLAEELHFRIALQIFLKVGSQGSYGGIG